MNDAFRDSLRRSFSFPGFRPGQEEALRHLLAGRHVLAVMPTGSGKSLIYQFASLHRPASRSWSRRSSP